MLEVAKCFFYDCCSGATKHAQRFLMGKKHRSCRAFFCLVLICTCISAGPDLPTHAIPRTRSVLGGPSPRRRNASGFRRTFEAQGPGAHVARRARSAPPRPRGTPPTSTRRFVSRCHKPRGDPISHTGFRCGQFTVTEGAQCMVMNTHIYIHTYLRLCGFCSICAQSGCGQHCPRKLVLVTLVAPRRVTDLTLS